MNKAYFHLPGAFEFYDFYKNFLYLYNVEKHKFNGWVEIGSIYGAPRDSLWGGGRNNVFSSCKEKDVADFLKTQNISCRITFTNYLLTEAHLSDFHCNETLKKFYNPNNGIIVSSNLLEDYIRTKYPLYKIISSTTKCITDKNQVLEELKKDYETVVLDYNFNKDLSFLQEIPQKDKCELLVNAVCVPNCSRRKQHYDLISKVSLHMDSPEDHFKCEASGYLFYQAMKRPLFISIEDIYKVYMPMGYKHFKIEGRTTHLDDLIEILIYYLVKPEHQIEIRERLYFFERELE